jgi:hypothetical protein
MSEWPWEYIGTLLTTRCWFSATAINMSEWPWRYIITVGSAFVGGIWSVYTFATEYREDRKWKQVEFLLDLNKKFFETADIKDCIRKLDNARELDKIKLIFESEQAVLTESHIQEIEKFKTLFQFFGSLHRCLEMKVLTLDHINLFGWFLYKIGKTEFVRSYCKKNGFSDVITLADQLKNYVYSSK